MILTAHADAELPFVKSRRIPRTSRSGRMQSNLNDYSIVIQLIGTIVCTKNAIKTNFVRYETRKKLRVKCEKNSQQLL